MYDSGDYTVQIADEFGVSHPTIYRHLERATARVGAVEKAAHP